MAPVIALDIDGTLGPYHQHFADFAAQWTGREMPAIPEPPPDVPFYKHLGMSKATYRQCKLAYRQGGMKRSMPVYPGVAEMTKEFRHGGATIWMCTTRPYLRLDNIDPDTRHWLRRNRIQYDHILFGTNKYRELVRNVNPDDVLAVLDDLPEMCYAARAVGLQGYIKDASYNVDNNDFSRVYNFQHDPWVETMLRYIRKRKAQ